MRVHVHSVIRNEEVMLPYFLRHYETFCEKIFLRIQPSTDNTLNIAKAHPKVIIIDYKTEFSGTEDMYHIMDMMEVRNNDWKKYSTSKNCDWIINADCDEFLYHPNILDILKIYTDKGITFPKINGFQMYSEKPPTTNKQIYDEIKTGFPLYEYCKRAIIHPDIDPNYSPGSHDCTPKGNIVESSVADLKFLHYSKQIFGKDALINFWKFRLRHSGKFKEENMSSDLLDGVYYLYELTMKSFMRYANTGKVDYKQKFLEVI